MARFPEGDPPLVSVVMSSFRDKPEVLDRAIDSVLGQDHRQLEVFVIFEPGDANGARVKAKYDDPRMVVIESRERLGRCRAYNVGISKSKGRYVARMDSDDQCLPHRISAQLAYFREHPELAVVGSWVQLYDRDGKRCGERRFPTSHEAFIRHLPWVNPICHPTVIWDVNKVGRDTLFDPGFNAACDDMELWLRMVSLGHRFASMPEVLLNYTQPPGYSRNRQNWRYMFMARAKHWRLILRHPRLVLGLPVSAIFSVSPQFVIDQFTGRSRFSDRLRSIR